MALGNDAAAESRPRRVYAKTPRRRLEIVEAATTEFAVHGYAGGSLRQIAKDLQLSVTSIMHHFPSKELLLEAVLEHAAENAARSINVDATRDGIRGTIARFAADGQEHPQLLRLLLMLSAEASAADHPAHAWLVARYDRLEQELTGWIIADPSLPFEPVGARVLARRIIALWDGLQLRWLLHNDFNLVEELDASVSAILAVAAQPTK
ncbi:TetR/AcrR family transcriptional regulator [Curtobacterium sp. MCBA15_013]|uniref:TetR/AcrR family transcriptional regulator n=1 Tax=Curtobacterium sp. MCBA15_013 TaxID=1898739 RepID=UPI0008DDBCD8|nr:TetR/AcrR family transcriptional regulator [Curtobacterium sp. MCBA15_013]OII18403.1 hypothetical protein BIV01_02330 [Curtobacterium sp. MCBA15_013]